MSFLGMGSLEILIILLVAFILLGPERMIDAGRLLGKATRGIRNLTAELHDVTINNVPTNPEVDANLIHKTGEDSTEAEGKDPVSFKAQSPSKAIDQDDSHLDSTNQHSQ